jgi:hypothetical protein
VRRTAAAPAEAPAAPTWQTLVAAEPRLADPLEEARAVRDPGTAAGFCTNGTWFGWGRRAPGFKPRVERLVGWGRPGTDPVLGSSDAYDVATTVLYDALPNCRPGPACLCA